MGCDGGTIPKRHELVKTAKRPLQKDKDMDRTAKWSTCTISQQNLTDPIMTCELGKLYSKESVLEFLLDRTLSESANHIRNLKDVKELRLTENVGYKKPTTELADQYHETQSSQYVCPVVGIEMNGRYKFCALWTCGCVLSERALKEVEATNCHNCGTPFTNEDVIVLNGDENDLLVMEENRKSRHERAKALKKELKEKRETKRKHLQVEANNFKAPLPIVNGSKALEVNVVKKKKKKDKEEKNKNVTIKKASLKIQPPKNDKIDVKQSKVYKSLFTSSDESKNRSSDEKAHWVTYNPYHL